MRRGGLLRWGARRRQPDLRRKELSRPSLSGSSLVLGKLKGATLAKRLTNPRSTDVLFTEANDETEDRFRHSANEMFLVRIDSLDNYYRR